MKHMLVSCCVSLVLTWNCLAGTAADKYWERELRQMGYLFLHISNINVINGLNLTRNQAVKLRSLARRVEAVVPSPPEFRERIGPEMQQVRDAWLALRDVLLDGQAVSESLERRANEGRVRESRIIRSGLRRAPVDRNASCNACHRAPSRDAASVAPMQLEGATKRLADIAHMELAYGPRGAAVLVRLSPEVNRILSDGQRAILDGFSCCLTPPRELGDPVRAGQAEVSARSVDLLRKVRACPEARWPWMRAAILGRIHDLASAINPGASESRRSVAARNVGEVVDRARSLSDVRFELEKGELAKEVRAALIPPRGKWPHRAAYFLLIPGASRVYTKLIGRLEREARPGAASGRR
ncbi:MAG: hypothetical protein GXP31_09680 [Kiritimatiellaeota bacterium]|nr:hypothetical protein [Kiritimatiellota bacterium]